MANAIITAMGKVAYRTNYGFLTAPLIDVAIPENDYNTLKNETGDVSFDFVIPQNTVFDGDLLVTYDKTMNLYYYISGGIGQSPLVVYGKTYNSNCSYNWTGAIAQYNTTSWVGTYQSCQYVLSSGRYEYRLATTVFVRVNNEYVVTMTIDGRAEPKDTNITFDVTRYLTVNGEYFGHYLATFNIDTPVSFFIGINTERRFSSDISIHRRDILGIAEVVSDPYSLGGVSGGGGGNGTFSDTSDVIDFPALPTLSAVGTGFITLFNPSIAQIKALSDYMWNGDATTIDFWKKLVGNPMDLILGLNIVPVAVPDSGTKSVVVGAIDTGVTMTYSNTQYVEIDCGTLNIPEFWGAYLDYSPYTKIEIYLPYCGTHPIIADEIVGKSISVRYHVDILSGACVAYVKCGNSVLYEFAGNCSAQIPVTSNQFGDMVRSAISIASAIGSMVATDGATAPLAISSIASASTNSTALKPNVEKSGAVGGMAGQLGIQKPYLIITRPKVCVPDRQNKYIGYPTYTTVVLSELEGYNEISAIHIEGVPATENEISELENILKTGVIF